MRLPDLLTKRAEHTAAITELDAQIERQSAAELQAQHAELERARDEAEAEAVRIAEQLAAQQAAELRARDRARYELLMSQIPAARDRANSATEAARSWIDRAEADAAEYANSQSDLAGLLYEADRLAALLDAPRPEHGARNLGGFRLIDEKLRRALAQFRRI